jgi:hypothetical protein
VSQFKVSGLITMDAAQAQAALKATKAGLAEVGTTGATAGAQAAQGADRAAGAMRRQAAAAQAAAGANAASSMQLGNLAAQFNDIGVMLAAGQNPLQLALQQGTQISQVIGPMGAGAAVRALGAAFMSVLSPVNLLTIGSIALGAALFQWLTPAEGKVQSLEDGISDLDDVIERFVQSSARASSGTAELAREFGSAAERAREMYREIAEGEARSIGANATGLSERLAEEIGFGFPLRQIGDQKRLGDFFDLSIVSRDARREVNAVGAAMEALGRADGIDQAAAATARLAEAFRSAAEASGDISGEEDRVLRLINEQVLALERVRTARERARVAAFLEERAVDRGDTPAGIARRIGNAEAREAIAELRQEAELRRLIGRFGDDSLQVAFARRDAERAVFAEMVAQRNASAEVKAELMAAWDAANGIGTANIAQAIAAALGGSRELQADLASAWDAALGVAGANMAGPISAAASAARGLSGDLAVAAANAWNVATNMATAAFNRRAFQQNLQASGEVYSGRGGDPRTSNDQGRGRFQYDGPPLDQFNNPIVRGSSGASGGGAREEADAVEQLIERLRGEIEAVREADPVKRELAQLRGELTGATAAERAEVENLIRQRQRETEAIETLNFVSEQAGEALIDALMGGKNAGEQLIRTLARAVAQAALLGQGPLASLFGGVGLFGSTPQGGGIFGAILGGLVQRRAGGGLVTGPGGPMDDRIPALLSNGEFVVRAAAVARNRALLEAINGGGPPRFAQGGFVGGAGAVGPGGGLPPSGTVRIALDPGLRAEIREAARADAIEIVRAGLVAYDRETLPERVSEINTDPRRRG